MYLSTYRQGFHLGGDFLSRIEKKCSYNIFQNKAYDKERQKEVYNKIVDALKRQKKKKHTIENVLEKIFY